MDPTEWERGEIRLELDRLYAEKRRKEIEAWVAGAFILVVNLLLVVWSRGFLLPLAILFILVFALILGVAYDGQRKRFDGRISYLERFREQFFEPQDPQQEEKRRQQQEKLRRYEDSEAERQRRERQRQMSTERLEARLQAEQREREEPIGRDTERVKEEMKCRDEPPLVITLGPDQHGPAREVELWLPKEELEHTFSKEEIANFVLRDGKLYPRFD